MSSFPPLNVDRDKNDIKFQNKQQNEHTFIFKADGPYSPKHYVVTKHYLGGGAFGSVFTGFEIDINKEKNTYKTNPKPYAIKQMIITDVLTSELLENEINILKKVSDSNCDPDIVCLYDSFYWGDKHIYYIVMEYIDGYVLDDFVNEHAQQVNILTIFKECVRILSKLHKKGRIDRVS